MKDKKKELLNDIEFEAVNSFDEEECEREVFEGKLIPSEVHISDDLSVNYKVALCKTVISFKNRHSLSQKNLCDILSSDKSTISLVCSYQIRGRLSETRLFKLVQKVVAYENSYTAFDELNENLKEATPLHKVG
ncbi:hypothetical protein [Halobacteriovorax sp. JY17]|uniref:hypothetical protein n=1 Tax=Halobacteriovorax sp. JY17 TaxID=2014617 RepID=UPI000C47035E|nr:hypothetical protein [Halobacteriovorax sp. JY17]PIK14721.1 MAG: hypothetical protein CES88_10305 [Halobacteriovorax sp. JY17]